jgi:uncharacterized protein (TIRG00374 family)
MGEPRSSIGRKTGIEQTAACVKEFIMADRLGPRARAAAAHDTSGAARLQSRWRLALGLLISLGILALVLLNRAWIAEALGLARGASPLWLAAALAIILGSYLISSQVFNVVLRSLGHRVGWLRLWATALVAIVTSQSLPAGGVGSYAFLLHTFRRRGIPAGQAALVSTLEALSYAGAMLLFSSFGLAYLASRALASDASGESLLAPLLAVGVALLAISGVIAILTRGEATLTRWMLAAHNALNRALRYARNPDDSGDEAWVRRTVAELARGRALVVERPGMIVSLVLIQMTALSGHSLALYLILVSLGAHISFLAVLAAFGIALLTSTFNVLPGGGGTVEAALVAALAELGAGAAAVPAAILFRLLNFWIMLPLAAVCYGWLMGGGVDDPEV